MPRTCLAPIGPELLRYLQAKSESGHVLLRTISGDCPRDTARAAAAGDDSPGRRLTAYAPLIRNQSLVHVSVEEPGHDPDGFCRALEQVGVADVRELVRRD